MRILSISKFQTRVCFTVEYINNNDKGRDILDICLSGLITEKSMLSSFAS